MSNRNKMLHATAALSLSLSLALSASGLAVSAAAQAGSPGLEPVREAAQKLGAKVDWDPGRRTVTISKGGETLILKLGDNKADFNGKTVVLHQPVSSEAGQTFADRGLVAQLFAAAAQTGDTADLFMQQLRSGSGAKAAEFVSDSSAYAFPAAMLDKLWINYEAAFGQATGQASKVESTDALHRNVTYSFKTSVQPFDMTVRLNPAGKIDDIYVAAASSSKYQKPAYDNPSAYSEKEVVLGEGPLALPGTLTLPAGKGPFPAVILVHGSGPNDRDETIEGAKPFRDLAAGLAAKGIAVLRYDKVTYEHSFKVAADPKFTVKRETVDDAISAVKLLKHTENIDPTRIFVAGHSQGGFAMPLIVDADKAGDIAGTILLAGPSGKFVDILSEQLDELIGRMNQLGMDTVPYAPQVAQYKAIAAMVNDPQYTVDHMPPQFPLQPAYWWFEQKNYVPAELAKTQKGPMLVLQGENDYQVPIDQFEGWKSALKDRTDVEFKSYPKVNHLLQEYDGLSIGAEYAQPANVSKTIIDDMANWIKKTK